MFLRKLLGFVLTTLLTGLFLNLYFMVTEDIDKLFSAFGILLTGTFPFILLIGVPVSIFSDYLTKNFNGKQRYKKSFLIRIIFGVITGFVISFFLESLFLVVVTLTTTFIFWLVDETLRKKITSRW